MKTSYLYAVFYFGIFALLLLLSGIWLFGLKIGFTLDAIALYYAGSETIPPKSLYGQLEVMVPHLGAIGLFVMVSAHFLAFAPKARRQYVVPVAITAFGGAFVNIVSGLVIAQGMTWFAPIKLLAFVSFSLSMSCLLAILLFESLRTLQHKRYM